MVVQWRADVIIAAIHAKVLEAVEASTREAMREAVRLAPKRRVFKGQRRAQQRQLTGGELQAERAVRVRLGLPTSGKIMTTREADTNSRPSNPYLRGPGKRPLTKFDADDESREVRADSRMRPVGAQKRLSAQGRYSLKNQPRLENPDYSGTVHDKARILTLKKSNSAFFQNQQGKWQLGGRLKGEINYTMEMKPHLITGTVISPTYYSRYVEFGTRHARAQPFMRPALAKERRHLRQRIEGRLRNLGAP